MENIAGNAQWELPSRTGTEKGFQGGIVHHRTRTPLLGYGRGAGCRFPGIGTDEERTVLWELKQVNGRRLEAVDELLDMREQRRKKETRKEVS